MLLSLISPAKTLDYESSLVHKTFTQPQFLDDSSELIEVCQKLSAVDLSNLMKISDKLAALNVARFSTWSKQADLSNSRQAIFAFKGDVYQGLDVTQLTEADLEYAQSCLRILSGLYGILRPLDLMMPYRLEMGTRLNNPRGHSLYEFWGDRLAKYLNSYIDEQEIEAIVNLASDEYFGAVNTKILKVPVVKPIFLDEKNGKYKVISFYAKKARGLMSRYIIQSRVTKVEDLKAFALDGYMFSASESNESELVFKRPELHN